MITDSEKAGYIKALLQTWIYETNAHMPAVVTGVNDNQTVNLQFAIKKPRMNPDGSRNYETSAEHLEVPVLMPSCGGFSLDMPIRVGCKGYVHHTDLDQDNFFLNNVDGAGVSEPHTSRYHSFNDIVFEPAFNGSVINGECMQLRSGNVTLKVCDNGFDVELNGESLIDTINNAFIACRCGSPLSGWKP